MTPEAWHQVESCQVHLFSVGTWGPGALDGQRRGLPPAVKHRGNYGGRGSYQCH